MRTPRGLLATLGATLSMVAAAACVLFFTSTLVAVKGWPGLSAPPNSGPVALAPVERAVSPTGGRSGAATDTPIVLGAPAATTTLPATPVGVTTPGTGSTPGTGGTGRIESGAGRAPSTTAPSDEQQQGTSAPATPVADAPSSSLVTTPAIQPTSETPAIVPALAPSTPTTGSTPTERRVAVNWAPGETQTPASDDDTSETQTFTPQTDRRSFARTPAFAPQEQPASDDEDTSTDVERAFAPQTPSVTDEESDEGTSGDGGGERSVTADAQPSIVKPQPSIAKPQTAVRTQPAATTDPCPPAKDEQSAAKQEPASAETETEADPAPAAKADPAPAAKADPEPAAETAPVAIEQAPAATEQPAATTTEQPAADAQPAATTTEAAPAASEQAAPAEQAPATPPC